jgi:hypothetical protein
MLEDKFIRALKSKSIGSDNEKERDETISKIQEQKRLSSKDFLAVYDSLWKQGPVVQYQNPDTYVRYMRSTTGNQNI